MPWNVLPSIAAGDANQVSTISVNNVVVEETVDEKAENYFSHSSCERNKIVRTLSY